MNCTAKLRFIEKHSKGHLNEILQCNISSNYRGFQTYVSNYFPEYLNAGNTNFAAHLGTAFAANKVKQNC